MCTWGRGYCVHEHGEPVKLCLHSTAGGRFREVSQGGMRVRQHHLPRYPLLPVHPLSPLPSPSFFRLGQDLTVSLRLAWNLGSFCLSLWSDGLHKWLSCFDSFPVSQSPFSCPLSSLPHSCQPWVSDDTRERGGRVHISLVFCPPTPTSIRVPEFSSHCLPLVSPLPGSPGPPLPLHRAGAPGRPRGFCTNSILFTSLCSL